MIRRRVRSFINLVPGTRRTGISLPLITVQISRKDGYYGKPIGVTARGEWEAWILSMLEVVEESARWTYRKIGAIRELRRETKARLKRDHPNLYSAELLDVLFHQPYCRIADVVEAGIAKRQAASTYLKALAEGGLLTEEKVGREKLFVHEAFLALLMDESDAEEDRASGGRG